IAKLLGIDGDLPFDESPRDGDLLPAIHRGRGAEVRPVNVERDEVASVNRTAHDRVTGRVPEDLEVHVVLVGPEPRHLVERFVLAEHRPRRRRSLVLRVLEMLDADASPRVRYVPRGEDLRRRRAAEL